VSKTGKKAATSSLLSKKTSMFATSDSVEAKVGVIGSGKGTTDFAQRKKHKF
jgi:survival-of-motor-neuron-related-splicing factor 30